MHFLAAGSTRRVAAVIGRRFQTLGAEVSSFDLAQYNSDLAITISRRMEAAAGNSCLFFGSPVYVSHAVPTVMECVVRLKKNAGAFAVPFVTWGAACSGIALFEMGKELVNKGFTLLGAAKILAVHSLMWQLEDPLAKNHPDPDDDRMVEELVNYIHQTLEADNPMGIALSDLAYQTKENHKETEKVSLAAAKAHMPERFINNGQCNQCQVCSEVCPTDSVKLTPYPVFGPRCIFCFNCTKQCPEQAIHADLSEIWQRIKGRAIFFSEQSCSKIFYP